MEEKRLQVTAVANKIQAHKCGRCAAFIFLCRGYEQRFPSNKRKLYVRLKCTESLGPFVLNERIIFMSVLSLNYIIFCIQFKNKELKFENIYPLPRDEVIEFNLSEWKKNINVSLL